MKHGTPQDKRGELQRWKHESERRYLPGDFELLSFSLSFFFEFSLPRRDVVLRLRQFFFQVFFGFLEIFVVLSCEFQVGFKVPHLVEEFVLGLFWQKEKQVEGSKLSWLPMFILHTHPALLLQDVKNHPHYPRLSYIHTYIPCLPLPMSSSLPPVVVPKISYFSPAGQHVLPFL